MVDVTETELPGVGIRYDYETRDGRRLGVLVHRTGKRDVLVYSEDDPDACTTTLHLDQSEARTLSDLLGASRIVEGVAALHQEIEGLTMDWITVMDGSAWSNLSLADAAVHTETGVSVVAILRNGETIPAPHSAEMLLPGDVTVAVGTAIGIAAFEAALRHPTES